MNSIKHINNALHDLDKEVEAVLLDMSLPMNEKDNRMLPLLQQKKGFDTNVGGFNIPKKQSAKTKSGVWDI